MKTFSSSLALCLSKIQTNEQKATKPERKAFWSNLSKDFLASVDLCQLNVILFWREVLFFYNEDLDETTSALLLTKIKKDELPPYLFRKLTEDEKALIPYSRDAVLTAYFNALWAMLDRLANFICLAVGEPKDEGEVQFASVFRLDSKLSGFWRTRLMKEARETHFGGLAFSYFVRNQICHSGFMINDKSVYSQAAPDFDGLLIDEWSDDFLGIFRADQGNDFKFLNFVPKEIRLEYLNASGPKILSTLQSSHQNSIDFATKTKNAANALIDLSEN